MFLSACAFVCIGEALVCIGEALVKSLYPLYNYMEGMTLAN